MLIVYRTEFNFYAFVLQFVTEQYIIHNLFYVSFWKE